MSESLFNYNKVPPGQDWRSVYTSKIEADLIQVRTLLEGNGIKVAAWTGAAPPNCESSETPEIELCVHSTDYERAVLVVEKKWIAGTLPRPSKKAGVDTLVNADETNGSSEPGEGIASSAISPVSLNARENSDTAGKSRDSGDDPKPKQRLAEKIRLAPVSSITIGICVVFFLLMNIEYRVWSTDRLFMVLSPTIVDYWNGFIWRHFTSAFTHWGSIHLLFNMSWVWALGRRIEENLGTRKYLILILFSAAVSDGMELLIGGQVSIGFSGVIYAYAGYGFVADRHWKTNLLPRKDLRLFAIWLVFGFVAGAIGLLNFANWAHAGGLAAGLALGVFWARQWRKPLRIIPVAVLLLAAFSSLYMPWSDSWPTRNDFDPVFELFSKANTGDPEAQAQYGILLLNNSQTRKEGVHRLEYAAGKGSVTGMNMYAWHLATTPKRGNSSGSDAVKWATLACEATDYKDGTIVDTLAAAYARASDWDRAVKTQSRAIELRIGSSPDVLDDMNRRLEMYQNQQFFIEEPDTE